MKFSFCIRKLSLLSPKYLKEILVPLTLGTNNGSMMCRRINLFLKGFENKDIAILVHNKDKEVIAWSLTYDVEYDKNTKVMLFVHPKYRKKGIGKKLLNKTFKYLKSKGHEVVYVAPWDRKSTNFYSKIKKCYWVSDRDCTFSKKVFL
jgi:GNAT superfamily N-acetyltransferase